MDLTMEKHLGVNSVHGDIVSYDALDRDHDTNLINIMNVAVWRPCLEQQENVTLKSSWPVSLVWWHTWGTLCHISHHTVTVGNAKVRQAILLRQNGKLKLSEDKRINCQKGQPDAQILWQDKVCYSTSGHILKWAGACLVQEGQPIVFASKSLAHTWDSNIPTSKGKPYNCYIQLYPRHVLILLAFCAAC